MNRVTSPIPTSSTRRASCCIMHSTATTPRSIPHSTSYRMFRSSASAPYLLRQWLHGCTPLAPVSSALHRPISTACAAAAAAVTTSPTDKPVVDSSCPHRSNAYPFPEIEAKWQAYWEQHKTFRTPPLAELDTSKPKFYALDMFPYPSGAGLHVGHPEGYTATDIMARYKRMRGYNVLHPMGWDAFGLPAEQYALQTGTHPSVTTERNINRFRQQLKSLGFSYDWDREVATTDPEYYKWTQWIFLQLFNKGLAYQANVPVNWCPALGTVLANEEVIDGKSERGGHPVIRMPMKQWMLAITKYADRLLHDLDTLDWSESIKDMQRNWIGRSEGAEIRFAVQGGEGATVPTTAQLEVYTTRPDTLFGATYMVVAPEHPMLEELCSDTQRAQVTAYAQEATRKSDLERTELAKDKTGVFTGSYAINPVTNTLLPIWVADYVLGGYGSGAIMAVPAHDTRDYEFATTFHLPIIQVIAPALGETTPGVLPPASSSSASSSAASSTSSLERASASSEASSVDKTESISTASKSISTASGSISTAQNGSQLPYTGPGVAINSSTDVLSIDGLTGEDATEAVIAWLEQEGKGKKKVNYKLRDWLFARQRYWGEPFPIVFSQDDDTTPIPIPESSLPLVLPDTDEFKPSGTPESPLANILDWVNTTVPGTDTPARRETSTMPQWAGSCWYYLRFIDPRNAGAMVSKEEEQYWMPVDLYVGGAEHAVLHLLYARFWHKVLYDLGVVSTPEPFQRLVSQGMILGEVEYTVYRLPDGTYCDEDRPNAEVVRLEAGQVEKRGEGYFLKDNPNIRVSARAHKMSKSRGNVINPDDIVWQYGADSLRLYEMFMGPLRETKVWNTQGVEGVHRFLARAYRLVNEGSLTDTPPTSDQLRLLHATIKKVTEETEELRFNTGISSMMEFVNGANKWDTKPREALRTFVLLLAPYAPHVAEELWQRVNGNEEMQSCAYEAWPTYDPALLEESVVKLPVQVNGKMRGTVEVPKGITQEAAMEAAKQLPNVVKQTEGKEVKKVVFVQDKILNIIVGK